MYYSHVWKLGSLVPRCQQIWGLVQASPFPHRQHHPVDLQTTEGAGELLWVTFRRGTDPVPEGSVLTMSSPSAVCASSFYCTEYRHQLMTLRGNVSLQMTADPPLSVSN